MRDGDEVAAELGAAVLDHGSPTAWFDELYRRAATGETEVPWDRGAPHPLLLSWLGDRRLDDVRAVVPGAGLGWDAEMLAARGALVTAFDVSPTAVGDASRSHPGTRVDYLCADLFDLPAEWDGAYDLVVEVMTIQSMPRRVRDEAIAAIRRLVAPGGTLLVIGMRRGPDAGERAGPPWPLTEQELGGFERQGLRRVGNRQEPCDDPARYLLELRRDA